MIRNHSQRLLGGGIDYYVGQLSQLENFRGLVNQDGTRSHTIWKLVLQASGLGLSSTWSGIFQQNDVYGLGMHNHNNVTCYGEWQKNQIQRGILHNKLKGYIFMGEYSDAKLSKAKGMKIYLQATVMGVGDEAELVEEGTYKNDQI